MVAKPVQVYLSLGSNLADREQNLVQSIHRLQGLDITQVTGLSSLYTTEPVGYAEQEDFLNAVAELSTHLHPFELLKQIQQIERDLGRVRSIRWGPRTLDLDILVYGSEVIELPDLQVPHPRMRERAFVLIPLSELNPDLQLAEANIKDLIKNISCQKISLFKRDWFDKLLLNRQYL